ncbi:MAG TPA: DUF4062 domain-containing protein [Thermoanaerobaculia bacterium]|nr:DUF4062 domain-containing protein [Thermoanaerobaculia bacterium]
MKIFVSSRMRELFIERKTAIEAVHFAGHTPLYIETEPQVKDEEARNTMVSLISAADAFLSIYYLTEGTKTPILNGATPIEFELAQFAEHHPGAPVFMFRKGPGHANPSHVMIDWFEYSATALDATREEFDTPQQLHAAVRRALRHHSTQTDDMDVPYEVTVRYVGPDYIGLIGKLTEIIFTSYKLNIDYISHAAHGGHSTVCLSCSPRPLPGRPETVDREQMEGDLKRAVRRDMDSAPAEGRTIAGANLSQEPEIVVDIDPTGKRRRQLLVKIRTIDAPGQLNAVCKQIRDLRYNIDELQMHPTPPEYPRQTTITLWLSRLDGHRIEVHREIDRIEGELQYLVGVRSLLIRAVAYVGSSKPMRAAKGKRRPSEVDREPSTPTTA